MFEDKLHPGKKPSTIPWADNAQYFFRRHCSQCLACLTAQGANKGGGLATWQWCTYHPGHHRLPQDLPTPSFFATLAEGLVRALASEPFIVTEWRALRGAERHGAFDFSMPVRPRLGPSLRWVHIEVDGQTHTSRGWQGAAVEGQQAKDREKDEAAWAAGHMLVRLHHRDLLEWGRRLKVAAYLAAQQREHRFILYTKSYGLASRGEPKH